MPPAPSPANAWSPSPRGPARPRAGSLRAARPVRYSVRREGIRIVRRFRSPEWILTRTRPEWTRFWTLCARLEWAVATARVERVRRRARPLWR
ncbi:hypothetical protein F8568_043700 [Actinomadura sp. LD22]|uniref:Uncharacterized protein n=1 Tax=Actinomadura physcomitrii TaxID=2650748 RepID=A0A6I4MQ41_9ACTN|nr:hypothetical protein [Actinomadura physcomitrii]MWA07130.1 hypothetical protein [Actinomadura physcomitrii]